MLPPRSLFSVAALAAALALTAGCDAGRVSGARAGDAATDSSAAARPAGEGRPDAMATGGVRDAGASARGGSDASRDGAGMDAATGEASAPACDATTPRPGLRALARIDVGVAPGELLGHAREIVVATSGVLLADGNGVPFVDLAGTPRLVSGVGRKPMAHCWTAALHAPSGTLFCGTPEWAGLDRIDVSDPAHAVAPAVPGSGASAPGVLGIADVEVTGDRLWLATRGAGLLVAPLAADGAVGELTPIATGTDTVAVTVEGGRVAALDRHVGLTLLDATTYAPLATTPLRGPPLDVALQGDRVAVALGSAGVLVLDAAGGGLRVARALSPGCVVTGVALEGDLLAATCLTGLYLYDLGATDAFPAGFLPARWGMLDVAFTPWGLVVSDWYELVLVGTDPGGEPLQPDAPSGVYVRPGEDASFGLRNPGRRPMTLDFRVMRGSTPLREGSLELPPGGTASVTVPADVIAASATVDARVELTPRRRDCQGTAPDVVAELSIAMRGDAMDPSRGHPAVGDPFPVLGADSTDVSPGRLPPEGTSLLVFFMRDCFLQWPELEDLAWHAAAGVPHGGATPLVLLLGYTTDEVWDPGLLGRFGARGLAGQLFDRYARSLPGVAPGATSVEVFEEAFMIRRVSGADYPHDHLVNAAGVVMAARRQYRGAWSL